MKPQSQFQIFEAVPDSLEAIRNYISAFGSAQGLDKGKLYKLCLAVDEIAANIINYGYPLAGINDGTIKVLLERHDTSLTVVLEDNATPFNPLEKNIPTQEDLDKPIEEKPIGGLGILIAKQSVDEFSYQYENGKNRNVFKISFEKFS